MNYNLQIEQSLSSKLVAQVGYVGSAGRHLLSIRDINQAKPGIYATSAAQNASRPYFSTFPAFTYINEIQSIGNSNYNSLQATLRVSDIHGFTAQAAYTWSHNFDEVTAYRGALPQDSTNFRGDYGPSDFDSRNTFVGLATYNVPGTQKLSLLSKGWQLNTLMTFHSGNPFSVFSSADTSGTDEGVQRANFVPGVSPYAGFKKQAINANWLNPAAFVDARRVRSAIPGGMDISVPAMGMSISQYSRTHRSRKEYRLSSVSRCSTCSIAPTLPRRLPTKVLSILTTHWTTRWLSLPQSEVPTARLESGRVNPSTRSWL